jgi:D-alanyl-lipoteichoic acid acyltransferase DltB (MBOAT superfamily)
VWNPGIGYFAYKFYIFLGGNRRKNFATVAAFVLNGLIHNLVVSLLFWRWDFPLPFTFLSFGIFTLIFRWLDTFVEMQKLPTVLHLVVNVGLVILSFDFGFAMNDLLK